jgi:hypothetical protein
MKSKLTDLVSDYDSLQCCISLFNLLEDLSIQSAEEVNTSLKCEVDENYCNECEIHIDDCYCNRGRDYSMYDDEASYEE